MTMSRQGLSDVVVVDIDVHVHETPKDLAPYCDMPWRKAVESMQNIPERYLSLTGFAPEFGGNVPIHWPGGYDATRTVHTASQMLEELESIHVDIGILFPDNLLLLATFPQTDYPYALASAYNRWLLDKWCNKNKKLKGVIVVAPQNPEGSAREIEKYKDEEGIVGVYLPCAGLDILWGHEKYDPIFHAAESAGLPILLHAVQCLHPSFPFNLQQYTTIFGQHGVVHPFSMMANMLRMIETGVPVRFPNLKIAFTEAGVSWVPFMMMRLDKEYVERRRQLPYFEHPPSHYIKNFYYGTQPIEEPENPEHLAQLIQMIGENQIMFASDWPHHDFDHPSKVFNLPLSPEAIRNIMGENALRFFNIDAEGNRLNLQKEAQVGGN